MSQSKYTRRFVCILSVVLCVYSCEQGNEMYYQCITDRDSDEGVKAYYVEIDNKTIKNEEYYNILTNPNDALSEEYALLTNQGKLRFFYDFNDNWVIENNITYIIWSIYDDFLIKPKESYYNIKYTGLEIPIKRQYLSTRPPPDYQFSSNIFDRLEKSEKYERIKEFYKEYQKIIVIYEFVG